MITLPKLKKRLSATLSIRSFAIGIGVGILLVVAAAAMYLNRGEFTTRADEPPDDELVGEEWLDNTIISILLENDPTAEQIQEYFDERIGNDPEKLAELEDLVNQLKDELNNVEIDLENVDEEKLEQYLEDHQDDEGALDSNGLADYLIGIGAADESDRDHIVKALDILNQIFDLIDRW